LTPAELADFEFQERVAIIAEGCKVDDWTALEIARQQRDR